MKQLMQDNSISIPSSVSSFGLESLLWNIPTNIFAKYTSIYRYTFDELLNFLRSDFMNLGNYKEVNGIKKLCTNTVDIENYKTFITLLSNFYQYDITEA
jgi:hypothetical protein